MFEHLIGKRVRKETWAHWSYLDCTEAFVTNNSDMFVITGTDENGIFWAGTYSRDESFQFHVIDTPKKPSEILDEELKKTGTYAGGLEGQLAAWARPVAAALDRIFKEKANV